MWTDQPARPPLQAGPADCRPGIQRHRCSTVFLVRGAGSRPEPAPPLGRFLLEWRQRYVLCKWRMGMSRRSVSLNGLQVQQGGVRTVPVRRIGSVGQSNPAFRRQPPQKALADVLDVAGSRQFVKPQLVDRRRRDVRAGRPLVGIVANGSKQTPVVGVHRIGIDGSVKGRRRRHRREVVGPESNRRGAGEEGPVCGRRGCARTGTRDETWASDRSGRPGKRTSENRQVDLNRSVPVRLHRGDESRVHPLTCHGTQKPCRTSPSIRQAAGRRRLHDDGPDAPSPVRSDHLALPTFPRCVPPIWRRGSASTGS